MDTLDLLGVALGLACLAGINLYLTVFVTGLAINQHWITLSSQYQSLGVLADPVIITVAGILYFLEFFADKVPWIDSAWDSVHTVIRPIGGALLAIQVLGDTSPAFTVLVALLAGTTSLATHSVKAATRLTANTSPEPFSNVAISVAEDVAVFGGLALIYHNPLAALIIFAAILGTVLYFAPKLYRAIRTKVWLVLRKLNGPADLHLPPSLPITLPARLTEIFARHNVLGETIAWALPCVSGRGHRIAPNYFGALVATNEEPLKLTFVASKGPCGFVQTIDLAGATVAREPKFLSENLIIFPATGKGPKYHFIFDRPRGAAVEQATEYLREKLNARPSATPAPESVPQELTPV